MGILAFIAEMTKALAWPLVVVGVLFIFRSPLKLLLRRLSSLRWGSWQAAFEAEGARVAEEIGGSNSSALTQLSDNGELLALAERSPRAAIIQAAIEIEAGLRGLATDNIQNVENRPPGQLIQMLAQRNLIDPKTANSLQGLFVMRNLAVHGAERDLTAARAKEFVTLANAILYVLHSNPRERLTTGGH
jgi:hypothetical protein